MVRKSASKSSASTQTLSTSGKSTSMAPHGRSSSFSKTSSKLTSFFSPNRSTRSVSPVAQSPTLAVPAIRVSPPGAEYDHPRPSTAPDYPRNWQEEAKKNAQFGRIGDHSHRHVSKHPKGTAVPQPVMDEPPYFYLITTYISYLIFIIFGHVRDFFGKRFQQSKYAHLREQDGYAPLNSDFDNFYVRRLQMRINDCFRRPVTGVPGRLITLLNRVSFDHNTTFKLTGTTTQCLNMSSYNYLGFAQSVGPCAEAVEETIRKNGVSMAASRTEGGTSDLHLRVEDLIARFVGKESAMVFSMGFGTNATIFSSLVSKGCLIISDELNHTSIRFGSRLSGAVIKMFKHNDMEDLERLLRVEIAQGQPRTHRPWKKILVVVEGLYSMEGTMCNLPALVELKKRYKFYLFVDEAHSIGALGPTGRGVCDYFSIPPSDVDVLMGTLTKSFGATGGYVAGPKEWITKLRLHNAGSIYEESMSPVVLQQIWTSLRCIMGDEGGTEGEERLQRLAFNSRYLRLGLKRLGFIVYGHDDSPIIPLLLYNPAKMPAFSHEMLKRKIAVVIVGYPATPLVQSRVRFCVSAAHTKDDLDRLLRACDEVGDILQLKFSSGIAGESLTSSISTNSNKNEALSDSETLYEESIPSFSPPPPKERNLSGSWNKPRWDVEEVIKRGVIDTRA